MMFDPDIILALKLSFWLASVTTIILLIIGLPLAWWLARTKGILGDIINSVVSLPLILPPSVLGFYVLILLAPDAPGGVVANLFGLRSFAFRFEGLVIGSVIFSLPFVVQPLQSAFAGIAARHLEAAASLGASPVDRFFTVALPMASKGLLLAIILGFAHTLGEFGVVLMLGGNIEGETRVISVAIFDAVEQLDFKKAHSMSFILLLFSFAVIMLATRFQRKRDWGF